MNKIKKITIILTIVLVSLVSFLGVYVQNQNRMENKVKDYTLGANLSGYRQISMAVVKNEDEDTKTEIVESLTEGESEATENTTESEENETTENKEEQAKNNNEITEKEIKEAKNIMSKRLKSLGAKDYIVTSNANGVTVKIKEDENTNYYIGNLNETGKFEIVDNDTDEVLMNNNDLKDVKVVYNTNQSTGAISVILNFEFNKEGKEKLAKLTNEYKTVKEEKKEDATETDEEEAVEENASEAEESTETEEKTNQKQVKMQIDGQELFTQSFDEVITNGEMPLTIGQATTDQNTLKNYVQSAMSLATLLNDGILPNEYKVIDNEFINLDYSKELKICVILIVAISVCAFVILTIKFKAKAILGAISFVGFMALYLLLIRYTNTIVTIESIGAIIVAMIINFALIVELLKIDSVKKAYTKFILRTLPILIISVACSFIKWEAIASFGMIMFWGIALTGIYNKLVTENLLK